MKLKRLLLLAPMAALLCSCGDIAKLISVPDDSEEETTSETDDDSSIAFPDPEVGKSKLLELGETEGFEIAFTMTADGESESVTLGFKNDTIWQIADGEYNGAYVKTEDGGTHFYGVEEGAFVYAETYDAETVPFQAMAETVVAIFYSWTTMPLEVASVTHHQTRLGRDCDYYVADLSAPGGSLEFALYIDTETGIAMKIAATAESEEGSSSIDFEVLSFRTGNQVTPPDLPAPTPAGEE